MPTPGGSPATFPKREQAGQATALVMLLGGLFALGAVQAPRPTALR
ncbi:MAG TPA: hypothetical protein VGR26_00020 [Acidimicrobiales bacterium]|nr:hypothetical protein [Acidimicrobiales bacterium]